MKDPKKHRPSTEEFIERSKSVHGDVYSYERAVYVNNKTNITVTCPDHGDFDANPVRHIYRSSGCPKCGNKLKGSYHKRDTAWFIDEAINVHGDKYDYSKVNYTSFHDKVEIICPEHGSFFQTAVHITAKQGCNVCSYQDQEGGYGLKRFENNPELKDRPGILYLIECSSPTEKFFKVGITSKTIERRFAGQLPYEFTIIAATPGTMLELFQLEQQLKKTYKSFKYRPEIKFSGHTECLSIDSPILDAFKT